MQRRKFNLTRVNQLPSFPRGGVHSSRAAMILVILVLLAVGSATAARGQTRTWTGLQPANDAWGQAANWLEAGGFVDGADVVFNNPGALQLNPNSLNNGTPNTFRIVNSITFNANSTSSILIDSGAANNVLRIDPAVAGAVGLSVNAAAASHEISAGVQLGKSQEWNVAGGAGAFVVSNTISELSPGQGLTKTGTGTLRLTANNTFTGGLTLGNGTNQATNLTEAGNNGALGNGSVTFLGARLSSTNNTARTFSNPVTFGAGGGSSAFLGSATNTGKLTFTGLMNLDNGSRTIQTDSDVELAGDISTGGVGTAGINKTGNATLTLSGNNSFSGQVNINAGILVAASDNALGAVSGDTVVSSGATLELTGGITLPSGETITINGAGVGSNGAIRNTGGSNEIAGNISVGSSSRIRVNANSSLEISGNVSGIDAGETLTLDGNGPNSSGEISGNISGGGGLIKTGSGEWTLSGGSITYSQDTVLTDGGGTLIFNNGGTANLTGQLDLGNNTTFRVQSGSVVFNVASGDAVSLNNGAGTSGTIQVDNGAALEFADNFGLNNSTLNLNVNGTGSILFSGSLANGGGATGGPNTLNKTGTGTIILTANDNNMEGTFNINAGTMQLGAGGATGALGGGNTQTVNVNSGGTLALNRNNTLALNGMDINFNAATSNATLRAMGTGTYNIGAATSNIDVVGSGGNVVWTADANATLNINVNGAGDNIGFTGNPTLELSGAGNGTINRDIARGNADGTVLKTGTGSWTLAGTLGAGEGWSTGGLIVNNGSLIIGASEVIPDGAGRGNVQVNGPGVLDVRFNETINGLSGNGTIDKTTGGAATLTVGANNATSTFSGTIQDTGTLTLAKTGTGILTLTGTLNYAGETVLNDNSNTLIFNTNSTFTLVDELNLGDNTTFRVQSGNVTFNTPSGDAATLNNSAGTSGIIQVDGGASLTIADNFGLNNSTLNLNVDGAMLISGSLASGGGATGGPNTLNKNGTGTLTFTNAANNMEGSYNLNNGLTRLDGATHNNATLTTVGGVSGQTANMELINGASFTGSDAFRVGGGGGTGILTVDGGSAITAGSPSANFVLSRFGATSSGTVNLIDGSIHSLGSVVIGHQGAGAYTQTDGATIADFDLRIAEDATSQGAFTLNGGTVDVGQDTIVGVSGGTLATPATLNVNGGTLTTPDLIVGQNQNSVGEVNQTNGTIFITNTPTYLVGDAGAGTVNQTGGVANVTGDVVVGNQSTAAGTYNLGNSGGTLNVGRDLNLAVQAGASGVFNLNNGGTLDFGDTNGGPVSRINIHTGGSFAFDGGTLIDVTAIDPSASTAGSGGVFTQNGGNFVVGRDASGPGPISTEILGGFTQTANNNATLRLDIFGQLENEIDMLLVDGNVSMSGTLNAENPGNVDLIPFQWYNAVKTQQDGQLITLGGTFGVNGLSFFRVIDDPSGDFGQILQVAVPEPAGILLWSLLGLGLLAWRRRRTSK